MTDKTSKIATLRALTVGVAGLACAAVPAAAAEPLQPATDWQFGGTSESCTATREFAHPAGRLLLRFRSFGPGSAIETTVASPVMPNDPHSVREVNVGWDGKLEEKVEMFGTLGTLEGLPAVSVLLATRPVIASFKGYTKGWMGIAFGVSPGAEDLEMKVVGAPHLTLAVGDLNVPFRTLRDCESDLFEAWGFDADDPRAPAEQPRLADPGDLWHAVAYPPAALLNHVAGILQVRLTIAPSGWVKECVVQSSPGSSRFGTDSCRAIERKIRYVPARDSQGQPTAGHAQLSITFGRF